MKFYHKQARKYRNKSNKDQGQIKQTLIHQEIDSMEHIQQNDIPDVMHFRIHFPI